MNAALTAYSEAVKRLSTGNALSIGERIRQLGVKTPRQAPAVLVDGLPIAVSAEEDEEEDELSAETAQAGAS